MIWTMARRQGQHESIAKLALDQYREQLMRLPNVVGVGVGTGRSWWRRTLDGFFLKVYVRRKLDQRRLPPQQRIPDHLRVVTREAPNQIVMVPTDIEVIGDIQAQ